jgi:hypothetical protein
MELRILIVVAPEHEEVLGGRVPALVRRSVRRRPSAGMSATASTTSSAGDGENRLQHLAAAVRGRLRPRRRGVRAAASCGVPMAETGTGDRKAIFGGMVVLRSRASISPAEGSISAETKRRVVAGLSIRLRFGGHHPVRPWLAHLPGFKNHF